jgi:hypothetical protein
MAKKKKKAKPRLSPSMFKVTGAHVKMKVDTKKKKMYYFKEKVKPDKAKKTALKDAPDILGVPSGDIKASKPSLKYDFYCMYDAEMELKFLRLRKQELGVIDQVKGAFVGKEIVLPKKGKNIPGKAIHLEIAELLELNRKDGMTLDGKTGSPASAMERVLKKPGKKKATAAWLRKAKVSPGKFNSIDKVIRAVSKAAGGKPSDAKRVVHHTLSFSKLDGFYIPTYYIKISAGAKSQKVRVNGINGALSLVV